MKSRSAFTLIELLVVIAIIGILSTLALIALGSARQKSRDAKRLADLNQVSKALEVYYSDANSYPTIITPGQALKSPDGSITYLSSVPSNPRPRNDGSCPDSEYAYSSGGSAYTLLSCIGSSVSGLNAGGVTVSNIGMSAAGAVSGLVGYWRMDEGNGTSLYDASGTGNNATLTNSPQWNGVGANGSGSFVTFDGTLSQVMTVADNSTVDLATGATVAIWYKRSTSALMTFGKYGNSTNRSYLLEVYNNYLYFSVSGDCTTVVSYRSTAATMPTDGSWHHMAATYDGSSIVLYKDGAVYAGSILGGSLPSSICNSAANLENRYTTTNYTTGSMDNIRLYNRALTAAEILELYNNRQ